MKERLDVLLVQRNLAESREKAKALIMSGIVYVEGQKEDKAGTSFDNSVNIEVRGSTLKYVSRGGLKLEKAMTHFGVELAGKICMDVGASTGGFTDCMLQNGAVKVYSVDVGHGQLAWKLRNDDRVVCMEKTNIRYVTTADIPDRIQFSSIDVSFISLTKVLGPVRELLAEDGQVVCLIKPQFEAGREKVGKKGVVREKSVHLEVVQMVIDFALNNGFAVLNLEYSPIKGPEGNIEYLLHLQKAAEGGLAEDCQSQHGQEEACRAQSGNAERIEVQGSQPECVGAQDGQLECAGAQSSQPECVGAQDGQPECAGAQGSQPECAGVQGSQLECAGAQGSQAECTGSRCGSQARPQLPVSPEAVVNAAHSQLD